MAGDPRWTRRQVLAAVMAAAARPGAAREGPRVLRIGVISASLGGRAQRTNGHTWHFAQYFHPTVSLPAIRKYLDPGSADLFEKHLRNPKESFDALPFPDTRIQAIYDADPTAGAPFTEAFPGVEVARSLDELARGVDAVWLGDASGRGEDHLELVAPGLQRRLPTFCDKPIGGTVEGTKAILDLARKHGAPLMSSSLFRHQWGTEQALRLRDSGELGKLETVIAGMHAPYTADGWAVYAHHPVWTAVTLAGPGIDAVSLLVREGMGFAVLRYPDRKPVQVWYGRPDIGARYSVSTAYFTRGTYEWTSAIEGNWAPGHHYEMFRMAATFREMVRTGKEPVPHPEILTVTAAVRAGLRSAAQDGRYEPLER